MVNVSHGVISDSEVGLLIVDHDVVLMQTRGGRSLSWRDLKNRYPFLWDL